MQVTLKEDIFSHFKKARTDVQNIRYGSKNEKVKLIHNLGNVSIVENKKGERFPTLTEKLNIPTNALQE